MKPVFMINGFLESGKTEFITFTLEQPYFVANGRTLLILCEEGEVEYDRELLNKSRAVIEVIEEESDFTPAQLLELEKKHEPERIIIEYNGMWNYKNMKMPWHWKIEQQITLIDGSTFQTYYTNMRPLLSEMLRKSDMIIFNRCDGISDLNVYKRNVKALNPSAEIIFEDENGEINEIFDEDLPYDISRELLELDNTGYGIWYIDTMDHPERYMGKKLQFTAEVFKPADFPEGYFVPGRMAMTCCADDMAFLGYACEYSGTDSLKDYQWVKVTATMTKEYFEGYKGEGPVLHALKLEKARAPKEKVISFV